MYEIELYENRNGLLIGDLDVDVKPAPGMVIEGMIITHIEWADADEDWGKAWIDFLV